MQPLASLRFVKLTILGLYMNNILHFCIFSLSMLIINVSYANPIKIPMHMLTSDAANNGGNIGYVTAQDTKHGLLLTPHLQHLSPGIHGFHIHAYPNCGDHGKKAGPHFDPRKTNKHLGPYGQGHLGDLPVLIVNKQAKASLPVLAPRLAVKDIRNHSLMIHKHGDNYSDKPKANGGGGKRLACGVIKP